jgi:CheY-like chemotaxis protein
MVADITFRGTEFQYVGARNADDGLAKANAGKPAIVLVDTHLAGKSGYDLCLAIKNNDKLADVPVIMLIGNGAAFDTTMGAKVGADGNLPKPWDTQTMLEKVTEAVARAANGVARPGAPAPAATKPVSVAPTNVAAAPSAAAIAAAAAAAANQPPRSATIMGMPTIKMPAGVAPPVAVATATPVTAAPTPTPPAPSAPASKPPATPPMKAPAPPAPAAVAAAPAAMAAAATPPPTPAATAATFGAVGGLNRSPMISGTPTKRSVLVERTLQKMAARFAEATGLEPGSPELLALLKLSAEVVERVVWEVVPDLAEQIIRENLQDLTARRS